MGRGIRIKQWTVGVSPQGIDIKQKDQVEKRQPKLHQILYDWKEFIFKVIFGLGNFHSSLGYRLAVV